MQPPNFEQNESTGILPPSAEALAHVEKLRDKNWRIRLSSAVRLAELGDTRATEPLCVMLNDFDLNVRISAAKALGNLGDTKSIDPLCIALKDENHYVRYEAAIALGKIGGTQAVDRASDGIADRNPETPISQATALEHLRGDVRFVLDMCTALKDGEESVRASAAMVLREIGDVNVLETLCGALKDPSEYVVASAVRALGEIGDIRAVGPLTIAYKKNNWIGGDVAQSLWKIGDATILPLRILSVTLFTPAQKLDSLLHLSRVSYTQHFKGAGPNVFCYPIGDVQIYCEGLCRQMDTEESVLCGAQEVLAELRNRADAQMLLRAGSRNESRDKEELLRGVCAQDSTTPPDELLRPSTASSERTNREKPGILSRIFKRK